MPDQDSPALAVLEVLGFALFVREDSGALRLSGAAPGWLRGLWPDAAEIGAVLRVGELSPFLENFLFDAEECWRVGQGRVPSGPWVERDAAGGEIQLEATALTAGGQPVLLLERLGEVFEAKKFVLQKARENVIAYQRLNAEMQKKEILLHCVAEEMTAAHANVITALRLIELEQDPAQMRVLLGLAGRAVEEQQSLIHKVLDVFAEDLDGFYGRSGGADLQAVVSAAVEELTPQFSDKGVPLAAPESGGSELRIATEAAHLHRIVANLLENALHETPAGRAVAVRIDDELEWATVRVEDGGETARPNVCARLFTRIDPSAPRPEPTMLRLHFCRIAVENCGGEIGCEPIESGNSFWIRLPKARLAR